MTESSSQAAQQAEAAALKERQAQESKAIKDAQKAKTKAFHEEAVSLDAGEVVVKEGDVLLVNRNGVDYKVEFDEIVDSLPICGPSATKDDLTGTFEYLGEIDANDLNTYVDNWPGDSTGNRLQGSSSELENIDYEAPLYKLSDKGDPDRTFEKFKAVGNYVTYIDADGDEQQGQINEWYEFTNYDDDDGPYGRVCFVVIEVWGIPKEDVTLTNDTKLKNACVPGIEEVLMSGDSAGFGVHLDGQQSTFMGAGIKANIIHCESVSYFEARMYAKKGINLGNHLYFASEYDDWYSGDQGQISNVYRIQFGDYQDQGKATDISKVENIYFKSGDEYANEYGGMISGFNALHFRRNEETDNSTQLTGLTKLRFTDNDDTGDAAEVTGLKRVAGDEVEVTGLKRVVMDEGMIVSLSAVVANTDLQSNLVAALPELPD